MNKMSASGKSMINLVAYALTLGVNFLGASGFFNGMTQKQVSDKYPTLITPMPFAFAIWGVIYLLLMGTLLYFFIKRNQPQTAEVVHAITPTFLISCALSMAWIITFSYEWILLSVLLIFAYLVTLTHIVLKLRALGGKTPWLASLAFGIYAGWLMIATVVNISALLVSLKWDGFGLAAQAWAVITLIISIPLVEFVFFRLKNAAFPLPVAWAYFAIMRAHQSPAGFAGQYPIVPWVAGIGAVLLAALAVWLYIKNGQAIFPKAEQAPAA